MARRLASCGGEARLAEREKEQRASLDRAKTQLVGAFSRFEEWADPRRDLAAFNDDMPGHAVPAAARDALQERRRAGRHAQQLWVRIFPDECLVDTFEATLTESEVKNASIFWREFPRVGRRERAARRVARGRLGHGSGRATWITSQFRPLDPRETWPKSIAAGDVLLVASLDAAPTDAERDGPGGLLDGGMARGR